MADIPALVRFDAYATLRSLDLAALLPLVGAQKTLARGEFLFTEGSVPAGIFLLLNGWTASSISVPDGGRQMLKVHLPGDMIGLPGMPLTASPDSVVALTEIVVAVMKPEELGQLFKKSPRLAALLFLISQEERFMLMDRLTTVGRVDTAGRLAGLILQLHARAVRHDPSIGETIACPLNQIDFADLIGTSEAHCNRTIQLLRAANLIDWKRQRITILDRAGLQRLSMLPERVLNRDQRWLPDPT